MCKSFPWNSKARGGFPAAPASYYSRRKQEAVMHVLLTGASGFIGNAVLRELLRQGHCVSACSREPERLPPSSPAAKVYVIDFAGMTAVEQWLPYLAGVDAIVNCAGIIAETETQTFASIHTQVAQALVPGRCASRRAEDRAVSALAADADAVRFIKQIRRRSSLALVTPGLAHVAAVAGVWRGRT